MYNVQMLWNYDVCVSRKSTGTVEVEFRSKTEPSWPSGSTAWFDIQPEVAQWLGLALLRASLQAESVQKAEVRAEFFKIMSAVKPPKDG